MKIFLYFILIITSFTIYKINAQSPDTWIQKSSLSSTGNGAVGFSIGNKGYIGTGSDAVNSMTRSFWEFSPVTNTWTQKANFGGTARYGAIGFSIGSKGYIGTGVDNTFIYKKDFWQFDPLLNVWSQKTDLGGVGRRFASGFSIGSKGYIVTGGDDNGNVLNDIWEYDPSTDTWNQKANFTGVGRMGAVAFCIGNKGYIGTGFDGNINTARNDFWEYDPSINGWTQKSNFGGSNRFFASGFSIENRGYIGTGWAYDAVYAKDIWEFDPSLNSWNWKSDLGGLGRNQAFGFNIGNRGYIGRGVISSGKSNDFWEYTPSFIIDITNLSRAGSLCSDSSVTVIYAINSSFSPGNIFTAQLSDANGSFVNKVDIGNITSITGGNIFAIIPHSISSGSGYRIRVVSSNPVIIGADNGIDLSLNIKPIIIEGGFTSFCLGGSVTLTSNSNGGNIWSPGGATTEIINVNTSGTYTVNNGCLSSSPVTIKANPLPTITSNSPLCPGNTLNLNASGGTSFSWTGPNGFTSSKKTPIITNVTNANSGNYVVSVRNEWALKANFGLLRRGGTGFSIGNKGYFGTGFISSGNYRNDFWEYDLSSNTWTQKANFGGAVRYDATGFSINNKGYIGTGIANAGDIKNDFWEYDPFLNSWTRKADFGGAAVYGAVGLSDGTFGYIGTGNNVSYRNDIWKYNPVLDTWTSFSFYPEGTYKAVGFSIGTDLYIGTGLANPVCKKDFWKPNGSGGWTQLADFGGTARYKAAGFSIGGKGYIGTGIDINGNYTNDVWEYDPTSNTWIQVATFGGDARSDAVGFNIGNKGYIGFGFNGSINKNDFWEFTPGNGCNAILSTTVSVLNPVITPTISSNSPVCSGYALNLSASGGTNYSWTGANVFLSTLQNPVISNVNSANGGNYTVVVSNICGSASASSSVIINPSPTTTAGSNSPVCQNNTINLNSSGGPTYSWTGPLNFNSTLQNPSTDMTSLTAGTYIVTVTNGLGCTSSASTNVIMNPLPTVTASSNSPVCIGSNLNLSCTVIPGAVNFTWNGLHFNSSQQNPIIPNATIFYTGIFSCTVIDIHGCVGFGSTIVNMIPSPNVTISNNGPLCEGSTLNLTSVGGQSYSWTGASGFTSTLQNPIIINATVNNDGIYTVIATAANACTASKNTIVNVFSGAVNDNNVCTIDACNTLTGPSHINIPIEDDGNMCTTDGCDPLTGMFHSQINIDDSNACTIDGCNSISGIFHSQVILTDDGNICTTDGCNSLTGVFHNQVNISDGDACTEDGCNSITGIFHNFLTIDDGNSCTLDGCNSITGVFHSPICNVTLNSNIFLEGYYLGGGLMNNFLNITGVSVDPLDADSIFVSAMDPSSPFAEVDRQPGILKTNGDVTVVFSPTVVPDGFYYLKINHRNSVETWSADRVKLTSVISYSFSSAISQAYLSNEALTFDALHAAIFTGDINHDGAVDASDFLELDPSIQNGDGGYKVGDLNGDGAVDASDFLVLDPNIQNGIGASIP